MFCEYARRESNPQLFLRRELLCPFNYGHINNIMKNNVFAMISLFSLKVLSFNIEPKAGKQGYFT